MNEITEEMNLQKDWYEEAQKQTIETLPAFIEKLTTEYEHDYGTICHAIAAAAIGAASAVDHSDQGGITGFQAGCIMWEFIKNWLRIENQPMTLMLYRDMLYPQNVGTFTTIKASTWTYLQDKAKALLANTKDEEVNESVKRHWQNIVDGKIPFGLTVREED